MTFCQATCLRAGMNCVVQVALASLFLGLWLNHLKAPLADLNVRQAMQYAIDRPLLNKQIFAGLGTIPNSVLMGFSMDASDSVVKPYTYDVAKAKQLMAKSKFPHGFSTTL